MQSSGMLQVTPGLHQGFDKILLMFTEHYIACRHGRRPPEWNNQSMAALAYYANESKQWAAEEMVWTPSPARANRLKNDASAEHGLPTGCFAPRASLVVPGLGPVDLPNLAKPECCVDA